MMRLVLWMLATGCLSVSFTSADGAHPPHIVLCMADDQGWGDMAYNGHPHVKTPVFDELAARGLRFDRFYAAAPVCSPTRASVLTGRTPNRSGVFSWGHSLRPQEITIAEALHDAGYVCGHFGKWHLGSVLAEHPTSPGEQGFDVWLSAPNFFDLNPWLSRQGIIEKFPGESSEVIVAAAVEFLRQTLPQGKPTLTVIWFGSPHNPHQGTAADRALYADLPPKQQQFLAEITAMDRAMGQLRVALRELQIADDTLLWYCSDNGAIPEGSTGGLRGRKGTMYEGGLRVPALIEWPRHVTAPRRVSVAASTVDIYPTLLDVAGVQSSKQAVLDGISLLPVITGHDRGSSRTQPLGFWEAGQPGFGLPSDAILAEAALKQASGATISDERAFGKPPAPLAWEPPRGEFPGHAVWLEQNWKLHRIEHKQTSAVTWELYNLDSDPAEATDLSAAEPARVATMQQSLQKWLRSVVGSLQGADYTP